MAPGSPSWQKEYVAERMERESKDDDKSHLKSKKFLDAKKLLSSKDKGD